MVQGQPKDIALSKDANLLLGKLSNGILEYLQDDMNVDLEDFKLLSKAERKAVLEKVYFQRYGAEIAPLVLEKCITGVINPEYDEPLRYRGHTATQPLKDT